MAYFEAGILNFIRLQLKYFWHANCTIVFELVNLPI